MQRLSEQKRLRAFALATALTLTCGFAALPQHAYAEGNQSEVEEQNPDTSKKQGEDIPGDVNYVGVENNAPVEPSSNVNGDENGNANNTTIDPENKVITPDQPGEGEDAGTTITPTPAQGDQTPEQPKQDDEGQQTKKDEEPAPAPEDEKKSAPEPVKEPAPVQKQQVAEKKDAAPAAKTTTAKKGAALTAQANEPKVKNGTYIIESGLATSDNRTLRGLVLSCKDNSVREGNLVVAANYQTNNNKQAQWWVVTRDGDTDYYTISAYKNTGLFITNKGGKLVLAKRATAADFAAQLWCFLNYGKNYGTGFQIKSKSDLDAKRNRAVDVRRGDGYNAKTYDPKTGVGEMITYDVPAGTKANQEYYLVDPLFPTVKPSARNMEGRYRMLASGTNNAVEIRRASKDNGASIWVYTNNNKSHQNIYLEELSNGYYIAWNMGTGKVFDVAHSSILVGANIIQWRYNGGANQQWAVRKNSNGSFTLINRATNLVFGAVTSSAKVPNCANIAGTQDDGRSANNFDLKRIALYPNWMICKIWNAANAQVLDVAKSSTANGAKVAFWKDNGQNNQRFQIFNVGNDQYRIRTASSGGWLVSSGNNLVQQGNHATGASKANTWKLTWHDGTYQFKNLATGKVLGGANIRLYSAPLTIKTGIFEINAKLSNVTLDNPGSSKKSGTRVNVYPDKNGGNQRWSIAKSGNYYKITNVVSGLVLCTAGQNIALYRNSSSKDQLWSIGIADGGYIKFINAKNGQALDITGEGNSVPNNRSTATRLYTDTHTREARQSWKLKAAYGWGSADSNGNRIYMRADGKTVKMTASGYNAWKKIQSRSSDTKYAVIIDNNKCRTYIFTGSQGNWEPCADWICTVGTSPAKGGDDTFGETFRGTSRILKKGPIMGNCPYELYWTEFYINDAALRGDGEGQRFHSILFWDRDGRDVYDATLGQQASHGCVRLSLENSKWMYYNVPLGSFVWSY